MNVYIIEIKAKLKKENEDKKLAPSLANWDGNIPLYYNNSGFFEFCTDSSKSTVFFDKRKAIAQSKQIYKHDYSRLIIESITVLTIKMRLALPLNVKCKQVIEKQ